MGFRITEELNKNLGLVSGLCDWIEDGVTVWGKNAGEDLGRKILSVVLWKC